MRKPALLIDGMDPADLIMLDELESYTIAGRPIVFSVGAAEVLAEFSKSDDVLFVDIAVVERGGEGILPALITTIKKLHRLGAMPRSNGRFSPEIAHSRIRN